MTNKIPYHQPTYKESVFNCPFCNAYSTQTWCDLYVEDPRIFGFFDKLEEETKLCFCAHCGKFSIWHNSKMIYPEFSNVEPPNDDLNYDIKNDYLEAASILNKSLRGAAAILQLALQKLMIQLGGRGKSFKNDFKILVKKGLPLKVQESLYAIKTISDEVIEFGKPRLWYTEEKNDTEKVKELFHLFNYIAEKMITEPKEKEYGNRLSQTRKKK